jgi:shikimate dehydrogenase
MSGASRLAAVIGDPVRHSLSPALLNAAFAEAGLDWHFMALEVAEGRSDEALDAVRALGLAGLSVTMPHKAAVAAAVDHRTEQAEVLDAVNCVVVEGGRLVGHNTDGDGFLDGLRHDTGFDPAGRSTVVIGAGGAARAVVLALARAGAAEVAVVNRTASRAEVAAGLAGPVGRVVLSDELSDTVAAADLVVNATSVGMTDDGALPVDPESVAVGAIAVDLIYHPPQTAWLAALRGRGIEAHNGLSMLVFQAAHAFRLWTGSEAPVAVMDAAARAVLATR